MKRALGFLFAAVIAFPLFAACGSSEGDNCKSDDDCDSNLTCQPVTGRGNRCCPTPASASNYTDCQPVTGSVTNVADGGKS
jgi:hypothetical protein